VRLAHWGTCDHGRQLIIKSTRTAASAPLLAVLVAAAGCATSTAAPPPTTTSTTAPVTPDQLALATLNDIVQGDTAAATVNFDQTMRKMLSPDALQQAWTTYQQQFGPYQSQGDPQDVARGKVTVVNVPLQMQNAPGQFRLSVQQDGEIGGLFFLREGVPVP
jgi:uncharacterized protein DUF3887